MYYKQDYKEFIQSHKDDYDFLIIDPPWNFSSKPPVLQNNQLTYNLWSDNISDLHYILQTTSANYIFLWTCNSLIYENMKALEGTSFVYKTMLTWVKQTSRGNISWGLGNTFRNCTEQMLVFVRKKSKALGLSMRNVVMAPSGKRTVKPKEFECELVNTLINKGLSGCYLFCGDSVQEIKCDKCDIV